MTNRAHPPVLARFRQFWIFRTSIAILGFAFSVEATEFQAWTSLDTFHPQPSAAAGEILLESPPIRIRAEANEVILSWNALTPDGSSLEVMAQAFVSNRWTRAYSWGSWTLSTNVNERRSLPKQKDADGALLTDTLRLARPSDTFRFRIRIKSNTQGQKPQFKLLAATFSQFPSQLPDRPGRPQYWGNPLTLPEISQHAFPQGKAWCSPTCVSMVLGYWAQQFQQDGLAQSPTQVASGVYDSEWKGTGNWSFNAAYAGSTSGNLFASVVRFRDLVDVEGLIGQRIPVVLSVSLHALRGRPAQPEDGHLVVVVGFDSRGDVWVHDPDTTYPPVPGKRVRRLYPRAAVESAWNASHRTAYVIAPELPKLSLSSP